jgi:four helix bundle protein
MNRKSWQTHLVSQPRTELTERTKRFALAILRLYRSLPNAPDIQILGKQLIRSATSVAANHRAALRGRSRQEFAAKIGIVREEADESQFWLELLRDSGLVKAGSLDVLFKEATELTAIFTTAYHTAKHKSPGAVHFTP